MQALIPLSVSALDPGYLELTKHKFLNDFSASLRMIACAGLKLNTRVEEGANGL